MGDWPILAVEVRYRGEPYAIDVDWRDFDAGEDCTVRHFTVGRHPTQAEPVFRLGRIVFRDRLSDLVAQGQLSQEYADTFLALAAEREHLPIRGIRINRKDAVPQLAREAEDLQSAVEGDASRHAANFMTVYREKEAGRLDDLPGDPAETIRLALEYEVVRHLRETEYLFIAPTDEIAQWQAARAARSAPEATDEGKCMAEQQIAAFEEKVGDYCGEYGSWRRDLVCGDPSAAQVYRTADNLRKNRSRPQGKVLVRLLADEATDVGLYRPYAHAMELVQRELVTMGHLNDAPSLALFGFMHRPHGVLDGIVPALHSLQYSFMRSASFRAAIAACGPVEIDAPGRVPVEDVCRLYGAILAVVIGYRDRVGRLRSQDHARPDRRAHQLIVGSSDDESDDERGGADGATPAKQEDADRLLQRQVRPEPSVDESQIMALFGQQDGQKILVLCERDELLGHRKRTTDELAAEHGVERRTIWRWCKEAQRILMERGAGLGFDATGVFGLE